MSFEVIDIEIQNDFQDIKVYEKFKIDDNKVYMKKTGNVFTSFRIITHGTA